MFVIIYNRETMDDAKAAYRRWPFVAEKWRSSNALSDVIDEAGSVAKGFGDAYKPKIFIEKD